MSAPVIHTKSTCNGQKPTHLHIRHIPNKQYCTQNEEIIGPSLEFRTRECAAFSRIKWILLLLDIRKQLFFSNHFILNYINLVLLNDMAFENKLRFILRIVTLKLGMSQ